MQGSVRTIDQKPAPEETPRRHFLVPLAALVLGLTFAAGYLVGSEGSEMEPRLPAPADEVDLVATTEALETTLPPTTALPAPTTTTVLPQRLNELVPGFDGVLTFVDHNRREALVWRGTGRQPVVVGTVPSDMQDIGFDAAGGAVAYTTGDEFHFTLHAGSINSPRPTALDVVTFVWHPTVRLRLAWIGRPDVASDTQALMVTDLITDTSTKIAELPPIPEGFDVLHYWIPAWGDWGFIVNDNHWNESGDEFVIRYVSPEGEITELDPGRSLVGASPTGLLAFADDEGRMTVTTPDGSEFGTMPYQTWAAVFNHDGTLVATIDDQSQLVVVSIADGLGPDSPTLAHPVRGWPIGFTSDSRYLVARTSNTPTGLAVIEVATGDVRHVPMDQDLNIASVH